MSGFRVRYKCKDSGCDIPPPLKRETSHTSQRVASFVEKSGGVQLHSRVCRLLLLGVRHSRRVPVAEDFCVCPFLASRGSVLFRKSDVLTVGSHVTVHREGLPQVRFSVCLGVPPVHFRGCEPAGRDLCPTGISARWFLVTAVFIRE